MLKHAYGVEADVKRVRFTIRGAVQGVGFRPFIYRAATQLGLAGYVENTGSGVRVEVEGPAGVLAAFARTVEDRSPYQADVRSIEQHPIDPRGDGPFVIRDSAVTSERGTDIVPDLATCDACLDDIFNPGNRRYLYPFTNCTNCGPRYSILRDLPYDRARTTMSGFAMCADCGSEYDNPADRRFHAEPIACPACGPQMALWDGGGRETAVRTEAIEQAASIIRVGGIVAVKGVGGFHLFADARQDHVVAQLRRRKRRPTKPFALMVSCLDAAHLLCFIDAQEEQLLTSRAAPIVLLRKRPAAAVCEAVAPHQRTLGIMLPYTPLHHILMRRVAMPLIATSGNTSDAPIVTQEHEALERLGGIADAFLVHDRSIARPVEDSVARVILNAPQVLRRGRGYAPLTVELGGAVQQGPSVLGLGGHLKSTVTLLHGTKAVVSSHIGDLDTLDAERVFMETVEQLQSLHGVRSDMAACDLHPDYASTCLGARLGRPLHQVQHHLAHAVAVMAEHGLRGPALGIVWDGSGLGADGTIWGGEFIEIDAPNWRRAAHLLPFRLPGGQAAMREPRRAGVGALHALLGPAATDRADLAPVAAFSPAERIVMRQMLERAVRAPWTSSGGRLFDACAALLDLPCVVSHEGEAAMRLEALAQDAAAPPYPFNVTAPKDGTCMVDWRPMLASALDDMAAGVATGRIARRMHETFAAMMAQIVNRVGYDTVVLTGGCFQNRLLTERAAKAIAATGAKVLLARAVPPNDGGLSLGQSVWARWAALEG